jgi:hypothetical protein
VQSVVALATPSLRDDQVDLLGESDDDEAGYLISDVKEMPEDLYHMITAIHPRYEKRFSKTTKSSYYANVCECGANYGDHFLHTDPYGAFFPMTDEAAASITIKRLPATGTFDLIASWAQGVEDLIFSHAKRI